MITLLSLQRLHEENEKLFDRLTEKASLAAPPQVSSIPFSLNSFGGHLVIQFQITHAHLCICYCATSLCCCCSCHPALLHLSPFVSNHIWCPYCCIHRLSCFIRSRVSDSMVAISCINMYFFMPLDKWKVWGFSDYEMF